MILTQAPEQGGGNCISNSGTVGVVVLVMFLFSVAVQMAEGLTYGVVPYVSRPALGLVSRMVGAGGNLILCEPERDLVLVARWCAPEATNELIARAIAACG